MRTFDIHTGEEILLTCECTQNADIRDMATKELRKPTPDKDRYNTFRPRPVDPKFYPKRHKTKDKRLNKRRVSRLMIETWIGRIPPGMEVDHGDFQRFDDRIDHIRLLPARENKRRHHFNKPWGKPKQDDLPFGDEKKA
jgi:hypothetical protein